MFEYEIIKKRFAELRENKNYEKITYSKYDDDVSSNCNGSGNKDKWGLGL